MLGPRSNTATMTSTAKKRKGLSCLPAGSSFGSPLVSVCISTHINALSKHLFSLQYVIPVRLTPPQCSAWQVTFLYKVIFKPVPYFPVIKCAALWTTFYGCGRGIHTFILSVSDGTEERSPAEGTHLPFNQN